MRTLLVHAPSILPVSHKIGTGVGMEPPLGTLYLASYVKQYHPEIEWKIIDGTLLGFKKCLEEFRRFKPDLVGVSFVTCTATGAYQLINAMKEEAPEVPVVCGGPHPSALPEEVFEQSKADVVVIGEGERAFLSIIEDLMCVKFKNKRIVSTEPINNIDEIPFPDRSLIDLGRYMGTIWQRRKPETNLISGRGCNWRKCFFCSQPVWRRYRIRSPANVVNEVELLHDKFGIREFHDNTDEFTPNPTWIERFYNTMKERNLDITWKAAVRADTVTESAVRYMAKSGCWSVNIGIESGNERTLDGIRKGITLEKVEKALRLFKKYSMMTYGHFMAFNVWEENGELRYEGVKETTDTLRYVKKLVDNKLLDFFGLSLTSPYPMSSLWDTAQKFHLIPEEYLGKWHYWTYDQLIMNLPNVSVEAWNKIRNDAHKIQLKCLVSHKINPRTYISLLRMFLYLAEQELSRLF